jgi:xanthine dehydrogenase YagS FAD-binding subunit
MKSFEWASAPTVDEAVKLLAPADANADADEMPRPMAGGQDLLSTMKTYIMRPARVVNLKTIQGLGTISDDGKGGLKIGATVTISDLIEHPDLQSRFPGLAEAAHSIATPQIRNLGSVGGNLCQRPRCWYYRLENYKCLKKGGTQCFAYTGQNKFNAILGGGPSYFVHPSDLAPMLVALGSTLTIAGPDATKTIPVESFFTLPTENIRHENILKPGEIITEIQIPATPMGAHSTYLKFKERDSLDFAMAAVAAAADLSSDKTVRDVRIVLGGVAPIPWRVKVAEAFLTGKKLEGQPLKDAADLALKDAKPLDDNEYKITLTKTLVRRALAKLNA